MKEEKLELETEKILNFIEEKKFNDLRKYLENVNSADFPSMFEELEEEHILLIYRLLAKEQAAEVFTELDSDVQEKIINAFTDKELKNVIDELFMDDTVDLIEEMPSNVVKRILKNIDNSDRKIVNELLNYPEESAGSIMTTEFIDLKENMSVEEAFAKIKKIGLQKETVYNCYVLSIDRKIKGVIDIKELLVADRDAKLKDIMDTNVITVSTLEDQEEVAKVFDKYNMYALPVVDKEERLVGIVTIDDAIDVMQEETSEDFEIMAAMTPNEDSYFKTSVFKHAKNRILWLLVLMLSSMVTGSIITHYEEAFSAVPVLVAFIPMLMGTGGNCGSQSSTLIIRGLAMDEIKSKDYFKALWKEFRVSIIVGIILAIANGIRITLQYQDSKLALVVGITIICVVALAKALGCTLPMLAKKLKLDPAIMAAPLITTIVDTCSVLLFFQIAVAILHI
ncbi:MAG: magnesium transporter [Clostridia bacterium]|nr:magnesium transporter [Clostridia bacterium]